MFAIALAFSGGCSGTGQAPGKSSGAGRASGAGGAPTHRVWEKVEIVLRAEGEYANPYADVVVWVDLEGPGFARRCYGFWDGGNVFRVRIMATAPGAWRWRSGSRPADEGLDGAAGSFVAGSWSEEAKKANPCRRGTVRPSANGHAFEYDDGAPFFLLGDTWWATPTFRYRWHDDDRPRPLGPEAGFKDYVAYRRRQGYNCIAMIAAFPNWHNDGRPARLKAKDGTVIRSAWPQAGTNSAKTMTDEAGRRAFLFPGRVPGYEDCFPDLERINPAYFHSLDAKVDHLNAKGIIPFIEVARRDIGQAWKKYYPWPDSYVRYIQYVWSRYQANICLFSPIHFDTPSSSISASDWNHAANLVVERYGPPPFGTLAGTNANPSSLRNYGHVDKARWLGFHQIGNRRAHDCYAYMSLLHEPLARRAGLARSRGRILFVPSGHAFLGQHPQFLFTMPLRHSFSRLCVPQMSFHSPAAPSRPRRLNRLQPRASLICPNTGSTVCDRFL